MATKTMETLAAGLVEACDSPRLFGSEWTPTPRQRALLEAVEAGDLLHVWTLGRRSGKTMLAALVALWMCLLRPELRQHVRRREWIHSVCVATSQRQARIFVQQAASVVEASPLLAQWVDSVTDDEIKFKNRSTIAAFPCTSRGGRGWPIACLLLDECAHQLDTEGNAAAEPIFRSLTPSVAQFGDMGRVLVCSTPLGQDGFFADLWHTVEKGDLPGVAVQASTMDMRPGFASAALDLEKQRDPQGFRSEYLAEFVASGEAFLAGAMLEQAVADRGQLQPGQVAEPEAAADLAFERDSSALAIIGRDLDEQDRLRLALVQSWSPQPGRPLSFSAVLDQIADQALAYGCHRISIDQFSSSGAAEHLRRRGLSVNVVPTTAQSKSQMYVALKQRLYEDPPRLELYRHDLLLAELRRIETVTTPGQASVRIRRLGSSHGDAATAVALCASRFGAVARGATILNPARVKVRYPRLEGSEGRETRPGWGWP